MDEFIRVGNWFDKGYSPLDCRFHSMKAALNLFRQRRGKVIVETGCARMENDWGAGMSTVAFADYLKRYGGRLTTIDNSPDHLSTCANLLRAKNLEGVVDMKLGDSVEQLSKVIEPIDLLYLDSYDYPYGDMLNAYGGQTDINAAIAQLDAMSLEEVRAKFADLIKPCQDHCLKELHSARGSFHDNTIVLIDDNSLPGGGKSYVAKEWLASNGWECLIDFQQTLWVRKTY